MSSRPPRSPRATVAAALVGAAGAVAAVCFGGASVVAAAPTIKPPSTVATQSTLPVPPTWCSNGALEALPDQVGLCWSDNATNVQRFVVYKRDPAGAWQQADQQQTDTAGQYGWSDVDTHFEASNFVPVPNGQASQVVHPDPDPGLTDAVQCYMVAAVNQFGSRDAPEQCTVRPNPEWFPQNVPLAVKQWNGLSDVDDGTGDLFNRPRGGSLVHANQTFGVDLDWSSKSALWKIEAAQSGTGQLVYGQPVALRVWGGGWLTYGHEAAGVGLALSSSPSYEWYVLGGTPGNPIDTRPADTGLEFALWDSRARTYLVARHQTLGVSLDWYKTDTSFGTVHAVTVNMKAQSPGPNGDAYLGSLGGGAAGNSVLTNVWFGDPQDHCVSGGGSFSGTCTSIDLAFLRGGKGSQDCPAAEQNSGSVRVLARDDLFGMGFQGMEVVWGALMPSLAQPLQFLACTAASSRGYSSNLSNNITAIYIDQ